MVVEHRLLELHVVIKATLVLQVNRASLGWRVVKVGVEVLAIPALAVSVALQASRIAGAIFFQTFCFGALAGFSLCIATLDPH